MPCGESAPDLCPFFRAPVQGSAEITVARMLERGEGMTDQRQWYAGVDWASESHHVFLTDGDGRKKARGCSSTTARGSPRWRLGCWRPAARSGGPKSKSRSRCRTAPWSKR